MESCSVHTRVLCPRSTKHTLTSDAIWDIKLSGLIYSREVSYISNNQEYCFFGMYHYLKNAYIYLMHNQCIINRISMITTIIIFVIHTIKYFESVLTIVQRYLCTYTFWGQPPSNATYKALNILELPPFYTDYYKAVAKDNYYSVVKLVNSL